jgi:hypothetical protein
MKTKEPSRLARAFAGSGHFLKESLEIARDSGNWRADMGVCVGASSV